MSKLAELKNYVSEQYNPLTGRGRCGSGPIWDAKLRRHITKAGKIEHTFVINKRSPNNRIPFVKGDRIVVNHLKDSQKNDRILDVFEVKIDKDRGYYKLGVAGGSPDTPGFKTFDINVFPLSNSEKEDMTFYLDYEFTNDGSVRFAIKNDNE